MQRLTFAVCLALELPLMACTKNDPPSQTEISGAIAAALDDSFPAGLDFAREEAAQGRMTRYLGYHWVHAQVPTADELTSYHFPLAYGGGMDVFRRVPSPDAGTRKAFLRALFGRPPIDLVVAVDRSWDVIPSRRGYLLTMSRTRSAPPVQKIPFLIVVTELGEIWIIPKGSSNPKYTDSEAREFLSTAHAPPAYTLTFRLEAEFNRQRKAQAP